MKNFPKQLVEEYKIIPATIRRGVGFDLLIQLKIDFMDLETVGDFSNKCYNLPPLVRNRTPETSMFIVLGMVDKS